MAFLMRQPPFWSLGKGRLLKVSDLFSSRGSRFARKEAVGSRSLRKQEAVRPRFVGKEAVGSRFVGKEAAVGAPLLARGRRGRGARRGVPGAVRRGRGAEVRLPTARGVVAPSPRFVRATAAVAHQVVPGRRLTTPVVAVVVFAGYPVDSITLLERQVEFETPAFG